MAGKLQPYWKAPLTPLEWLEIATYKLAPEAAARVRLEYLAHLEDALEAGENAADVLYEWGDPHRANKTLCQAHLTIREAPLIHTGYALSWAGWQQALEEEWDMGRSGTLILQVMMLGDVVRLLHIDYLIAVLITFALSIFIPTLRWLIVGGFRLSGARRVTAAWLISGWTLALLLLVAARIMPYQTTPLRLWVWLGVFVLLWLWRLGAGLKALRKVNTQTP